MEIRNIAIIAHVDHGKTTLTDALMHQTKMADEDVSMDSNVLEKERGITIYSKNTSLMYKDTKINIVDTPGHADFSSEVERILRSIDSVLLLVDAQEGPMPQTRFVLAKSLELNLKPIVVINKIDKPAARPHEVHDMILELFMDLGANNEQLDFETMYTIAKQGIAKQKLDDKSEDLSPLLDLILEKVRPASSDEANKKPLRMQSFNLAYDNYVGRMAIGRIYEGKVKKGMTVVVKESEDTYRMGTISNVYTFYGLNRKEVDEAVAGDIVMIAGLPNIYIGETICQDKHQEMLPAIKIDEPTISLDLMVNSSPFTGREGKHVTSSKLKERLEKELEVNVGLKIDFNTTRGRYKVYGRGELHIAIFLENMRRENFEVQVSQPKVIIKNEGGVKQEPYEEVIIDVPKEMAGMVIEKLSKRKGTMIDMKSEQNNQRLVFEIPTRGILGYRGDFIIDTRGEGIFTSRVIGFRKYAGTIDKHEPGSMISMKNGKALSFALWNLEKRGRIYIYPNTDVYSGMVIGDVNKGNDMWVNPIKGKKLTNLRASGSDDAIALTPPVEITLERGLEIMKDDEFLEVTPKNIRLRKKYLTQTEKVRKEKGLA
ncbi:translational GTPase TypA [Patescibacteria group bacterium AH-259-L05]|nr:translational GTPase TypA [Patescibacteria group bacterium AH-259-L05]